jgi:hypothetical protein
MRHTLLLPLQSFLNERGSTIAMLRSKTVRGGSFVCLRVICYFKYVKHHLTQMSSNLLNFYYSSLVTRHTSPSTQVQSAGKRRQPAASSAASAADSGATTALGTMLFHQADDGEGSQHPWSWVRDYQRPPSRQLPPEMALFLDNHPDDVSTPRQQSPYNCSDAGMPL